MPVYEPEIGVAEVSLARAVSVGVELATMDPEEATQRRCLPFSHHGIVVAKLGHELMIYDSDYDGKDWNEGVYRKCSRRGGECY